LNNRLQNVNFFRKPNKFKVEALDQFYFECGTNLNKPCFLYFLLKA